MQGKRNARELYLQTKMDSEIVLKPKSKKGLIIFVLFATVISLKTESYGDVNAVQFSFVMSYDGHLYICRACDKTMKRNFIPWQGVCNKMGITFLPKEFESINRLERVLYQEGFA